MLNRAWSKYKYWNQGLVTPTQYQIYAQLVVLVYPGFELHLKKKCIWWLMISIWFHEKKYIFQIPGSIWVVKPCLHPLPFPFPVLWLPPDPKDWHLFHLEVNMIIYECFEKLKENPIGLQTKFRQFRRRLYLWKIRQEDRKCGIFIISYI